MKFDRVCVDASLALAWIIPAQVSDAATALWRKWEEEAVELVGPPMFHAEVTAVLREEVFFKRMSPEEGEESYSIYLDILLRVVDSPAIYRRAWELAREHNQRRTYDMQYLAVAELADCEFWSGDKRLVNSLQGKVSRIRWVGEYTKKGA